MRRESGKGSWSERRTPRETQAGNDGCPGLPLTKTLNVAMARKIGCGV